jgi:DNA-binding NarL/FixJ family response regulator
MKVVAARRNSALGTHLRGTAPGPAPQLTNRQSEVLHALADGLSFKAMARELQISPSTVKAHVSALYRSLGACNRSNAVGLAHRFGLMEAS